MIAVGTMTFFTQQRARWIECHSHLILIVLFPSCSYMFDEPSSYLDVKQRLKAALAIRSLISSDK